MKDKNFGLGVLLFAAVLAAGALFAYFGKAGTGALYSILPRSIASVNGQPIYQNKYDKRLALARRFLGTGVPEEPQLKTAVLNQLIEEEKISQVAAQRGVTVSKDDIDGEYGVIKRAFEKEKGGSFEDYLKSLDLNQDEFKQEIVKPDTLYTKLAIWHNSQQILNPESFSRLAQAQNELDRQTDFDTIVRLYSDKSGESALQGDLGFVPLDSLLPEMRDTLENISIGSTQTIYTRYGIHVVKVTARDNAGGGRLYLKQVFIQTQDFGEWLEQQTKNYRVKWG